MSGIRFSYVEDKIKHISWIGKSYVGDGIFLYVGYDFVLKFEQNTEGVHQ